ncbi:ribonuclease III [uncultured Campylobacter sp.]|uniref:ribonuclease III n=1 Tax=uncultured Campylobacter sp. TaxID=218934 RepID=UPI002604355B|nr:ribonuclease III [uncultured Campylobacter sp.]
MRELKELEKNLDYEFKDRELFKIALTHKSVKQTQNNERLEFLGDAVLDLVVGEYLFSNYKDVGEGELSKLRAALVNEQSFSKLARSIGLQNFIYLSFAEEQNNGRGKDSIVCDAFEALMGAIYLESGLKFTKNLAIKLIKKEFPVISLDILEKDYKTRLQELTQSKVGSTPKYELISAVGPDHKKEFDMAVVLDGKTISSGKGRSKKAAEQEAAKKAIEILKRKYE